MALKKESLKDIFKECKKNRVKLTLKELVCLLVYLILRKFVDLEKIV